MAQRRGIDGSGIRHRTQIPAVSVIGPMIASSVIGASAPGTHQVPDHEESQVANLFAHIDDLLEVSGAHRDDLVKVEFWTPHDGLRTLIEAAWIERFPDRFAAPARHIHRGDPAQAVHCAFWAYRADPADSADEGDTS